MDLPWGDERTHQFVTSIGLVTSRGPHGDNVEAVEWTHQISYKPGIIAVCISPADATHDNIKSSKEFGVNIAAEDQATMVSVAGNYTGRHVDKIKALEELGYIFYHATEIKALMIEGAAMNAECRVIDEIELGDHTMFIGGVLKATSSRKKSLVYYQKKFWKPDNALTKPSNDELEKIQRTIDKNRKPKANIF